MLLWVFDETTSHGERRVPYPLDDTDRPCPDESVLKVRNLPPYTLTEPLAKRVSFCPKIISHTKEVF